jgi:hypothetical protein
MRHLTHVEHLQVLDVGFSPISRTGAQTIRRALPGCHVSRLGCDSFDWD